MCNNIVYSGEQNVLKYKILMMVIVHNNKFGSNNPMVKIKIQCSCLFMNHVFYHCDASLESFITIKYKFCLHRLTQWNKFKVTNIHESILIP